MTTRILFFQQRNLKRFSGRTVMKDLLKEWKEKPPGGAPLGGFYFRVPWQQTLRFWGREYLWPSVFHFIWVELMKLHLRVLEGIVHAAFWCYYLLLKLLEAVWLPFRLHRWFLMHMTQFSPTCGALQSLIIERATGEFNYPTLLKMAGDVSKHSFFFPHLNIHLVLYVELECCTLGRLNWDI